MKKNTLTLCVLATMLSVNFASAATSNYDQIEKKAMQISQAMVNHKLDNEVMNPTTVNISLKNILQRALDYNHDIKIAEKKYEQARIAVSEAAALKNPKLTYNYQGVYADISALNLPIKSKKSSTQEVMVTLPIYTGGAAEGALGAARYGREIAKAALIQAQEEAKMSAVNSYYMLLLAREKQKIANESVANLEKHLKQVETHYRVGTVAKSDVLATKVALSQAHTLAIQANNGAALAEAALNNVIGLPIDTKLNPEKSELLYGPYDITLETAKNYALAHRVELVQAALAIKAAEENVSIANAGQRPKVGISAGPNWKNDRNYQADENRTIVVGAKVSFDLWDGGQTKSKVENAKSKVKAAQEVSNKAIDGILLDVSQAYLNLQASEQTIKATEAAVLHASENFKIASVRYLAGVGTNLDVLDAELNLGKAKTAYKEALFNYNIAVFKLEKAMGIILDEDPMAKIK